MAEELRALHRQLTAVEGKVELHVARFADHIKANEDALRRLEADMGRLWQKVDGKPAAAANGTATLVRFATQAAAVMGLVIAGLASLLKPEVVALLKAIFPGTVK